jgi:uncharacterized protein YecT (DUF1311 family)
MGERRPEGQLSQRTLAPEREEEPPVPSSPEQSSPGGVAREVDPRGGSSSDALRERQRRWLAERDRHEAAQSGTSVPAANR